MSQETDTIKTIVIKIGTTLLQGDRGFDGRVLEAVIKEIIRLRKDDELHCVIVSSGAIGCGMDVLNLAERPKSLFNLFPHREMTDRFDLLSRHFDARKVVVMANATFAKTEFAQE